VGKALGTRKPIVMAGVLAGVKAEQTS